MGLNPDELFWPDVLDAILAGTHLDAGTSRAALDSIMGGSVDPILVAGFLVALRAKGETTDEMIGLVEAMLAHAVPVHIDGPLLDTCGTGGDRAGTVNVSTMAALVCAGAGVRVAKHGNRAASSKCGSADVLEALGVDISLDSAGVAACINEVGIGFMLAPMFHPALKHVMPVRRTLGIRTIFNVLGPLANPARADRQVVGVSDPGLGVRMIETLSGLGKHRALVVHGADGLDELTTTGVNRVWELSDGVITHYELDPMALGFERTTVDALRGDDAATNAAAIRAVLAGEQGPMRDVVILNAAAGLRVAGKAQDYSEGVAIAADAIDSGAAQARLDALIRISQSQRGT